MVVGSLQIQETFKKHLWPDLTKHSETSRLQTETLSLIKSVHKKLKKDLSIRNKHTIGCKLVQMKGIFMNSQLPWAR